MLTALLASPAQSSFATLGEWAKPPDPVAWVALALGVTLLVIAALPIGPRLLASLVDSLGLRHSSLDVASIDDLAQRRRFLVLGGFLAAFLSLGYIAYFLRGGPRAFDATSYFLEGRALSHGVLTWAVQDPSASFRGRSLLFDAGTGHIGCILPPGYPLLLSAGFMVGAPMVVGPLLAAAIATATYMLAKEIFAGEVILGARTDDPRVEIEAVGRLALVLSLICATLRYHTADTMAQGASALAITLAVACALRARRTGVTGYFAASGLACGFALATRPASALPVLGAVAVLALAAGTRRPASLVSAGLALLPGLAVLALANHFTTGSVLVWPELAYEHGFAASHFFHGLHAREVLFAALKDLRAHAEDVANFEPLALLVVAAVVARAKRNRAPLLAFLVVIGTIAVYAPFSRDESYPGAGARLYADVLPIEHALVAFAIARVFPAISRSRKALVVVAMACAGFALHGAHAHEQLARSNAGRPLYEPDVTRDAGITQGVLFFDSDEGFNLAHVPNANASDGVVAARLRNDDHDRLLYDRTGHEPVHRYVVSPGEPPATPSWIPPSPAMIGASETWRFEAESDWPVLFQASGWAAPLARSDSCVSNGHALEVVPEVTGATSPATATIALPVPRDGRWRIMPRVFRLREGGNGVLTLQADATSTGPAMSLATWTWSDKELEGWASGARKAEGDQESDCLELAPQEVDLTAATHPTLMIEARDGPVSLDRTNISSAIR